MKTGLLLINLGTPDALHKKAVRAYLKEFLSDPRVVDIPGIARWILVNLLILPFRTKKTTEAYEKIWTESGSPLLINTKKLAEALQKTFGDEINVAFGMRYGKPSINSAIEKLDHCDKIIVLPLFPQYSSAATGSALEEVLKIYAKKNDIPTLQIINDFFDQDWFIEPYARLIQKYLEKFNPDFVLFSYHGLPERQDKKNQSCYRNQCFATTTALTKKLDLNSSQYATSFQSRLGRTPWIKPYTDEVLLELYDKGIRRLAIVCPSFTADCLETLEEINIRAKDQWLALGGEAFLQVPCLNDDMLFVEMCCNYFRIGFG